MSNLDNFWPESWADKTWTVSDWDAATRKAVRRSFTDADLRSVYIDIEENRYPGSTRGWSPANRCVDRALQTLRKAGLIEYVGRTWRVKAR